MTAILHRGLRNCFFYVSFTFSNFYLDFYFPSSIWTFMSLFYLEFSFSIPISITVSILFYFFFTPIAVTFWISSKFLKIRNALSMFHYIPSIIMLQISKFAHITGLPNFDTTFTLTAKSLSFSWTNLEELFALFSFKRIKKWKKCQII